jgi:DNA-binding beta-propeller fold protein YncE
MAMSLVLLGSPAAQVQGGAAGCGAAASSRTFTGGTPDAPFFILDGGTQGNGLGQYDSPEGMALVLTQGRRYLVVSDTANDRIKVMTHQGFFQDFWGRSGNEPGRLRRPMGMAMSADGAVWVADSQNHRIQKLSASRAGIGDLTGRPLLQIGGPGADPGQFNAPAALAVGPDGSLYVADTMNHRIQKLDPQGRFLTAWGSKGSGRGQLQEPRGIAVDGRGGILVADTGNDRVQRFGLDGRWLASWGRRGEGAGDLRAPQGLALDEDGFIYVADTGNHRVQKLSPRGEAVASVGCLGTQEGQFQRPVAVAVDTDRSLYVLDSGNHRVQKLGPQ